MRADLNKQLCEEERHNSSDCYGNYRHDRRANEKYDDMYDLDNEDREDAYQMSGARESMKQRYKMHWHEKEFGEHLNPLYGQIRKAVGRKWDDFYSELSKVFDTRSVINRHILLHLYDHIDVDGVFVGDDGELYSRNKYNQQAYQIGEDTSQYYVDPRDGIIKINRKYKHYRTQRRQRDAEYVTEQQKVRRVVDDTTELHNLNGVWFEIKFRVFKPQINVVWKNMTGPGYRYAYNEYVYPYLYDVLKKETVSSNKVAVSKRTLSHKELKKHGLV